MRRFLKLLPEPVGLAISATALVSSLCVDGAAGRSAEFFVSAAGNDTSPGTKDRPVATLARAQQAARQARGGIVTVRAGTYYLAETIVFAPEDSGTEYRAAEGETVVLSGGTKLELKWEPYRDGIMQAKTPVGLAFDQLFVNGQRQIMARYPNYDASVQPYGGYAADAVSQERAKRWADPAGGFIHAMHSAHWGGYHYRITGKNERGEITYVGGWQNNRQMGMHPQHRYVENIFEELDAPGEWFHNATTSTLVYFPAPGVDLKTATVEVVRLRHLFEFHGSQANPVKNVTLRGFTFRHAARTFMDVKEPLLRSDWTIYRGGAVLFSGAEECAVQDCEFDQLGGNAVFVNNYNRRLTIRGCDFHDTGASAVAFVGDPNAVRNPLFEANQRQSYADIDQTPGPKSDNYPADCRVEDCLIRRLGVVEKQATGVEISMALGITVRHCSIYEASRAAINIGDGCWGGHVVEFCDVFDTVRETGDHGSFNSWGRDRYWNLNDAPPAELPKLALLDGVKPIVLRNNRWRCDHGWDVDLDDGSSHYEIYNNVFLNGGLKLREGFHRRVWNNIAVNNSLHPHVWFENSGDVVTNNIWMGAYRPAAMSASLEKWGRTVDRNLFTTTDADRARFLAKGCDANSLVGDARFVDPAQGDFRVRDDSPALKLGFRNFPMDQFGVQKPSLKAIARRPEIPPLKTKAAAETGGERRIQWQGATLGNLVGEQYSVFGVARDAPGVLVAAVPPSSAAARLGLRTHDFIESVNDQPVKTPQSFVDAVHVVGSGNKVKIKLIRNQKSELLPVNSLRTESLREPGFTAMWWTEGPPNYLSMKGPPPPAVLCLRSGEIGLVLDTQSLRLLHAGRFATVQEKDAALEAGTEAMLALPPAELSLAVTRAGRMFVCVGRGTQPKDEFFQPVRFVETGRFFQHVVIEGLQFATADGTKFETEAALEIALWPDRLSLSLELGALDAVREGELSIAAAGRRSSASLAESRRATLELFAREPKALRSVLAADPALTASFDEALGCHIVRLPEKPWSNAKGTYYPEEHLDRLDRWRFTLRNDGDCETVARLMFVQEQHLPITGFTPMLCDPDGTPSGLPVQISKNWHQRPDKGHLKHEGPWFHGCTFVRLPARSHRALLFQMVYARYGGVPAASHAQLSLIGWGHNQFWDEAAIGSFGESICYEPGRVQRRCFIDDLRPLMTLPVAGGKPWGWAENCGGGDFLMWVDEHGAYRGFRATRTDYRAYGPCLTDVRYLEETAGGEIAARMEVSLARSDDYLRAFHRLRYDVQQPVRWQRLAFFQLGADFYNDTPARRMAVGDATGVRDEWTPPRARNSFDRRALALTGVQPWASIHGLERTALSQGGAAASRGMVIRSWRAVLDGKPHATPHLSTFCTEWGKGNFKTVIELAPPADLTALRPGDFVEADVEIVVFPADAKSYYGPNQPFRGALARDADTWRLVHHEAAGNALRVQTQRGTVRRTFPLVIAVDDSGRAAASLRGGVGWMPVTFTGLASHRGHELRVDGKPFNQSVHGNDYWQTSYDAASGYWSQTVNLLRDDDQPLHLEFGPVVARTEAP